MATSAPPAPPTPVGVGVQPPRSRFDDSTPRFLGRWIVVLPILIAVVAITSVIGAFLVQAAARSSTASSGPSLIGLQDMFASVAEANAAATAAHLATAVTGQEDRVNRNLYVDARGRATDQVALVAADLGPDDPAQEPLRRIARSLATYSGDVEAARLANLNQLPNADDRLVEAVSVVEFEIGPAVAEATALTRDRFDRAADQGRVVVFAAIAVAAITLVAMIWMQYQLALRTHRLLNPFLVLSTVAVVAVLAVLMRGELVRSAAIDDARFGGLNAIGNTAELQSGTFAIQSELALALLDEESSAASGQARFDTIEQLTLDVDSGVEFTVADADSDRERAAGEALRVRWDRYRADVDAVIAAASSGQSDEAARLVRGPGLSSFNGVNTAIESVLSDNRTQFIDGVERAGSAVEFNPWLCLLLSVAAGLLAPVGIQRRLGDYQ